MSCIYDPKLEDIWKYLSDSVFHFSSGLVILLYSSLHFGNHQKILNVNIIIHVIYFSTSEFLNLGTYWHFGPNNCLLWGVGAALYIAGYLAAFQLSTH